MSKYGVFSGQYFPIFSPNTGKYGPEKTPYLDIFHALLFLVLKRMKKHGIKIKACKSQLFCREISYLGLLVSSEGFTTDLKNVVALTSKIKKRLKTIFEFHTVLGFVSYF